MSSVGLWVRPGMPEINFRRKPCNRTSLSPEGKIVQSYPPPEGRMPLYLELSQIFYAVGAEKRPIYLYFCVLLQFLAI